MSNSISANKNYNPIVFSFFDQADDKERTKIFMIKFFQNFVLTEGKPNGWPLNKCVDAVNNTLLEPVRIMNMNKNLSSDQASKIHLWMEAHRLFEMELHSELVRIGFSMEKAVELWKEGGNEKIGKWVNK